MSSYCSNSNSKSNNPYIIGNLQRQLKPENDEQNHHHSTRCTNNPHGTRTPKRQRTPKDDASNHPHNTRCVLLFDMDCFYAQCERVRLGLPLDTKLCLFQWNSVLAVTYPAREYGIKRGDSWEEVSAKTKKARESTGCSTNATSTIKDDDNFFTIHLPILGRDADNTVTKSTNPVNDDDNDNRNSYDHSVEASYRRIFDLSPEEQLRCQRTENGLRRFHHEGKACLERYRLASMRIFEVVLESLQKRITQQCGYSFILERASIDEFYLDLTDYCFRRNQIKDGIVSSEPENDEGYGMDKTIVAGQTLQGHYSSDNTTDDSLKVALNRACRVSNWIRQDIWKILGFTMSSGISTNKTMAKLAASYGKPNGQAVLHPKHFSRVLAETKITKVRNFGGKLGRAVLKVILKYQQKEKLWDKLNENESCALERLKVTATMGDLNQIPLPFLIQSNMLSKESARFVFSASQGVDHEEVKETSGALVKSITAFKSFSATKSHAEIFDRWLCLLATEIIERVARDTMRNKRYPKSCTLTYTYYITSNGRRPPMTAKGSSRSQRQSRSLRLLYPSERKGTKQQKSDYLLSQAKSKLIPIVKEHPLRGVGLSVSNFTESSKTAQPLPEGTVSIQSYLVSKSSDLSSSCCAEHGQSGNRREEAIDKASTVVNFSTTNRNVDTTLGTTAKRTYSDLSLAPSSCHSFSKLGNTSCGRHDVEITEANESSEEKDLKYAKKLQASFDRENYALSTASRRQKSVLNVKRTKRIDSFFKRR